MAAMDQQGIMALPEADAAAMPQLSLEDSYDAVKSALQEARPDAAADMDAVMKELVADVQELSDEELDAMITAVQQMHDNPEQYPQLRAQLIADGQAEEEDLPPEYDPEFLAVALSVLMEAKRSRTSPVSQTPQGFAKGGIASAAQALAKKGRYGDTMLAHITPREARMLRKKGGSGTINPKTGLPEFFLKKLFRSVGRAVKKVLRTPIGRIIGTIALGAFLGPAGMGLVSSAVAAPLASGLVTLGAGGNLKDALKSAAFTYIAAPGNPVSNYVSEGLGNLTGLEGTALQAATSGVIGTGTGLLSGQSFSDAVKAGFTSAAITAGEQMIRGGAPKVEPTAPAMPTQATLPTQPTQPTQPMVGAPVDTSPDFMGPPVSAAQGPASPTAPIRPISSASSGLPETVEQGATTAGFKPADQPATPVSDKLPEGITPGTRPQGEAARQLKNLREVPGVVDSASNVFSNLGKGEFGEAFRSAKDLFMPSAPTDPQVLNSVQFNEFLNETRRQFPNITPSQALKMFKEGNPELFPSAFRRFGPMAAAGTALMGAAGGFKPQSVQMSPEQQRMYDMMTGGTGSFQDLLARDPTRYFIQNLPGVNYYGGSLYPQRFAKGGIAHFEGGGPTQLEDLLPDPTPVAPPADVAEAAAPAAPSDISYAAGEPGMPAPAEPLDVPGRTVSPFLEDPERPLLTLEEQRDRYGWDDNYYRTQQDLQAIRALMATQGAGYMVTGPSSTYGGADTAAYLPGMMYEQGITPSQGILNRYRELTGQDYNQGDVISGFSPTTGRYTIGRSDVTTPPDISNDPRIAMQPGSLPRGNVTPEMRNSVLQGASPVTIQRALNILENGTGYSSFNDPQAVALANRLRNSPVAAELFQERVRRVAPPVFMANGGMADIPLMQKHFRQYWENTRPGQEIDWAGGKLYRLDENSAHFYDPDTGTYTLLKPNMDFAYLASQNPKIAAKWKQDYGFEPPEAARGTIGKPSDMATAYARYWEFGPKELDWAGGKLVMADDRKSAVYTNSAGERITLTPSSNFVQLANMSPSIAALWKTEFGFNPNPSYVGGTQLQSDYSTVGVEVPAAGLRPGNQPNPYVQNYRAWEATIPGAGLPATPTTPPPAAGAAQQRMSAALPPATPETQGIASLAQQPMSAALPSAAPTNAAQPGPVNVGGGQPFAQHRIEGDKALTQYHQTQPHFFEMMQFMQDPKFRTGRAGVDAFFDAEVQRQGGLQALQQAAQQRTEATSPAAMQQVIDAFRQGAGGGANVAYDPSTVPAPHRRAITEAELAAGRPDPYANFMADGGIAALAKGGYPRRTGQISGPGTETSDSIPAMLSDGEFVMTAKAVRGMGNGSRREGAKRMYKLMHQLERNASRG